MNQWFLFLPDEVIAMVLKDVQKNQDNLMAKES